MSGTMDIALRGTLKAYDRNGDGIDPNEARLAAGSLMAQAGPSASFFNIFKLASNQVTRPAEVQTGAFSGVTGTNVQDLTGSGFSGLTLGQHEYESDNYHDNYNLRYFFYG